MSKTTSKVDPHARKFGVEIECGISGGPDRVHRLFNFPRTAGYRQWHREDGWSIGSDGSGVELRTPPLSGEAGFKKLRDAMEKLKRAGAYVTTSDGLHVHHDAPEFVVSASKTRQLVYSWVNNREAIAEMVTPFRRTSRACPEWGTAALNSLDAWFRGESPNDYYGFNRYDLNIQSLEDHGTIEIRLHEGTLDPDVAIAWIKFGQRLLHGVVERARPMRSAKDDASLMSRLRLSAEARAVIAAKKASGHITSASNFRARGVAY